MRDAMNEEWRVFMEMFETLESRSAMKAHGQVILLSMRINCRHLLAKNSGVGARIWIMR